ncbi:hypothetical protein E4U17_007265 [Claviceps sp. LM77 group G4]|nr:hypothetical protein E4U17_007265 [Claviceps sp. LM77 group G4]KAG6084931.1 hypothetical protein E4U33_002616 [Claviceps sp. LM78 group G4]
MSDRPRQSRRVLDHIEGVFDCIHGASRYNRLPGEWDRLWTNMFSGEYPELPGKLSAVYYPALHAFCEAIEQNEAHERAAAAAQRGMPPGEPHNTAFQTPHGAAFYAMGPIADPYNVGEAVTTDTITLNKFWLRLQAPEGWQRQEETPVNTFDKAWLLLERRQQMAEAGMPEMKWFLVLLLQEEFAGIFPTNFTAEQWYRLLQANFHEEDCKILFLLDLDRCRQSPSELIYLQA